MNVLPDGGAQVLGGVDGRGYDFIPKWAAMHGVAAVEEVQALCDRAHGDDAPLHTVGVDGDGEWLTTAEVTDTAVLSTLGVVTLLRASVGGLDVRVERMPDETVVVRLDRCDPMLRLEVEFEDAAVLVREPFEP